MTEDELMPLDQDQRFVEDINHNRATIAHWGSVAAARASLSSLDMCNNCIDCSDCFACAFCKNCTGSLELKYCIDCMDCMNCSRCVNSQRCETCRDCSNCWDMYQVSKGDGLRGDLIPLQNLLISQVHRTIFYHARQPGALEMGHWHTCQTTHCRAGWAVHLAGESGKELEERTSPAFAAMQVYRANKYLIPPMRFIEMREESLADMKRLAEEELAAEMATAKVELS